MTDEDNVTRLHTGYEPETVPPDANEVLRLQWAIALLADEIKQISVLLNKQTRGMAIFNNKLAEILRYIKKE